MSNVIFPAFIALAHTGAGLQLAVPLFDAKTRDVALARLTDVIDAVGEGRGGVCRVAVLELSRTVGRSRRYMTFSMWEEDRGLHPAYGEIGIAHAPQGVTGFRVCGHCHGTF